MWSILVIILAMGGKFAISGAYAVIYLFSTEQVLWLTSVNFNYPELRFQRSLKTHAWEFVRFALDLADFSVHTSFLWRITGNPCRSSFLPAFVSNSKITQKRLRRNALTRQINETDTDIFLSCCCFRVNDSAPRNSQESFTTNAWRSRKFGVLTSLLCNFELIIFNPLTDSAKKKLLMTKRMCLLNHEFNKLERFSVTFVFDE